MKTDNAPSMRNKSIYLTEAEKQLYNDIKKFKSNNYKPVIHKKDDENFKDCTETYKEWLESNIYPNGEKYK